MTETPNPLDIATELEGFAEGSTSARASLMRDAAAVIRSLVSPPTTDDEREALADKLSEVFGYGPLAKWGESSHTRHMRERADKIMASAPWRNRGLGPITDEEREALLAQGFDEGASRAFMRRYPPNNPHLPGAAEAAQ